MTPSAEPPPPQLMVIFSLGGLWMTARARGRAIRCIPGFLPMDGSRRVILDPFPEKGMRGVLEDGVARLFRGEEEVASQDRVGYLIAKRRWTDLDLLIFASQTLWTWIGLPLEVRDRPGSVLEVDPHGTGNVDVLYRDEDGNVVRHVEGDLIHELSDHCEFGGAVIATRRRTRVKRGVTVLWADVVAAAMHGKPLN